MRKLLKKAACLFLAAAVMTAFLPEGFGLRRCRDRTGGEREIDFECFDSSKGTDFR